MGTLRNAILTAVALAAAVPAGAADRILTLDPHATRVTFLLEATGHDVEGVLGLRGGEIRFDPAAGSAAGEIVVELTGAKTGNDRRDRQMHEDVLETPKFPVAVFRATGLKGKFVDEGVSQLSLDGVLNFHGTDHPATLQANVTSKGGRVSADVSIPIPFVEWGLKDPSILFLRVAKVVAVNVKAEGTLSDAGTAAAGTR